jgi:hypothetical protein
MARLTPERAASSFKVMPAYVLTVFNRRPIALSSLCWSICPHQIGDGRTAPAQQLSAAGGERRQARS